MTAHVIQIFATTANPSTLYMSNDNGDNWTLSGAFITDVNGLDTVQYKHSINKGEVTNNISSIQGITPAVFFEANKKPKSTNNWTGTIRKNNPAGTSSSYSVKYNVTNVPPPPQSQDPKLKMNS